MVSGMKKEGRELKRTYRFPLDYALEESYFLFIRPGIGSGSSQLVVKNE